LVALLFVRALFFLFRGVIACVAWVLALLELFVCTLPAWFRTRKESWKGCIVLTHCMVFITISTVCWACIGG
jgi:hypothetical protein